MATRRPIRLSLERETLRQLTGDELAAAAGGLVRETCTTRLSGCSQSVTAEHLNQICCN